MKVAKFMGSKARVTALFISVVTHMCKMLIFVILCSGVAVLQGSTAMLLPCFREVLLALDRAAVMVP